jgi:hypothetical protein
MDPDSWRQAKSVLEAALLCPPDEREALIAARCADASLRREVLACLHENDESFLESALTISHTFDTAVSGDDVEAPPEVQPGERIADRYEIVRRLGAGGMGAVFLAKDTDLERLVAVKFLISAASSADIRSRIFHEARAAARIIHPNIAIVYEVGVHDGRAFLVMEYVEGESLAQLLKHERPSPEKILSIGRQLAAALVVAHENGIIHRDLKPANIQLARDGSAKILDFGVAHVMAGVEQQFDSVTTGAPLSTLATLRTERGTIRHPGTPAYMSPEQMFGKPIDGRSDIYSLGVILYEMATGHRPYSTDDPLDVVLALSHKLLRPSGTETHLPEAVNDIIGKMLTVDLDLRYQNAAEVETALTALIAPDAVPTVSVRAPQSRAVRVIRVAAVVSAVPVCVVVLGLAETAGFNLALGRPAAFDNEGWRAWLENGVRSLVLPVAYEIAILSAIAVVRFMRRMLSLSGGIDHLLTTGAARTRRLGMRIGLDDPVGLAQGIAAVGFVILAVVVVKFWPVLDASFGFIDTYPSNTFAPLGIDARRSALGLEVLNFVLSVLLFAFGAGVYRIARLRSLQRVRRGIAPLVIVVVMLVLVAFMLFEPYRIQWRNKFDRVVVGSQRCYVLGERGDDWLVYCPDRPPPHNRVVSRTDPAVRKVGINESIFATGEATR